MKPKINSKTKIALVQTSATDLNINQRSTFYKKDQNGCHGWLLALHRPYAHVTTDYSDLRMLLILRKIPPDITFTENFPWI